MYSSANTFADAHSTFLYLNLVLDVSVFEAVNPWLGPGLPQRKPLQYYQLGRHYFYFATNAEQPQKSPALDHIP